MAIERAISEFMAARQIWEGKSSELLSELNKYAAGEDWPQSPKALTQKLKVLHTNEIKVGFRRLGTARLITLAKGGDTFGDTSEAELVTHVEVAEVTDKSTVAQAVTQPKPHPHPLRNPAAGIRHRTWAAINAFITWEGKTQTTRSRAAPLRRGTSRLMAGGLAAGLSREPGSLARLPFDWIEAQKKESTC